MSCTGTQSMLLISRNGREQFQSLVDLAPTRRAFRVMIGRWLKMLSLIEGKSVDAGEPQ